jgi:hypothetical protein
MREKNLKPAVVTTQYEFSHGRKPRGRGSWFFYVRPWRGAPDARSDLFAATPGVLFSEARDEAVCRAYDLWAGDVAAVVEVLP